MRGGWECAKPRRLPRLLRSLAMTWRVGAKVQTIVPLCHCEEERSDDVAIPIVERKAVP